ncbi:NAD(P)-dependent oxidoreductase [uncultured Acinetobacter sp.]|uniref:NAD(P)-dependent oxidoreductase n=1 Tax=uncultured Acinetobacter sp. TaxID=165433 RepID=UPI0025929F18|nr:NAD(P)-dependent oxidoreductase [uncultured Acinetobacter sp.]
MTQSVSFIGLGAMGWHMASHLPKLGINVQVWNRTEQKAQAHAAQFATQAVSIQQAVQADIIISCLPTSADIEALIAQHPPKSGAIWVDCTSGVPDSAKKLADTLKNMGAAYLDAPVSGQTIGAERGTLTVMVGGDADAFAIARPIIQAFADLIEYVGESGAGFTVKAVNNTLMATHLWALAEGLSILKAQQVDLNSALSCINHSSGQSGISQNIMAQRVLSREFPKTFALDLLQKDIGIASDLMHQQSLQLNLLKLVQQQFNRIEKSQAQQLDFSAAVQNLEQDTQLTLQA